MIFKVYLRENKKITKQDVERVVSILSTEDEEEEPMIWDSYSDGKLYIPTKYMNNEKFDGLLSGVYDLFLTDCLEFEWLQPRYILSGCRKIVAEVDGKDKIVEVPRTCSLQRCTFWQDKETCLELYMVCSD